MEFLKQMAQLLGLPEDATEEQVLEALKAIIEASKQKGEETEAVANKEVLEALGLDGKASVEDVKGKIISLKNPAGFVSIADFNSLKDKIQKKESNDLVQVALSQGKITPAQKEWAEEMALKDPSGFKKFTETAPQVVPLDEIDISKKTKADPELDMSINKMLGISKDDIEKYGKGDE